MILSFSKDNIENIKKQWKEILKKSQKTVKDLHNLIGGLSSTGVLPAQYKNLQHPEI